MSKRWLTGSMLLILCLLPLESFGAVVSGDLTKWHRVTIDFTGPSHDEMDDSPNPFLDYRLQVTFTSPGGGTVYSVPGFFDGNGNGGGNGTVWRVRFAPDEAGTWSYQASFRSGSDIAVSLSPAAGSATSFDGESGQFTVADLDPGADGFLKYGRLESIGEYHLKFRDGGYWVKLGTNNPENLLGYQGFDNTPYGSHAFANHVADWQPGDPDWDSPDSPGTDDGRGIIGALNYLADQYLNSIYFMPMNIGADGKDTWPFADPTIDRNGSSSNDNVHYDISKLTQWETVFDHAQRKELYLHFVLSDKTRDNKNELSNATLGVERKLFYRELVARFGHHNGLQWNISEEYNLDLPLDPAVVTQFGEYIDDIDPYDHPITVHPHGNTYSTALAPFFGEDWFTIMSVQTWQRPDDISYAIEYLRDQADQANNIVPVMLDESIGMNQLDANEYRKRTFWDALLSGGGFEMFKSYGDSGVDDFRVYEDHFEYARYAREFVVDNLPVATMEPADGLVSGEDGVHGGAEVFADEGEIYAIYLPSASPQPTLSLNGVSGNFEKLWYNPRTGDFEGSSSMLSGGSSVGLGSPPSDTDNDWVVLVRNASFPPVLSNGLPDGDLPAGTTETALTLDTDVAADCRYATAPGVDYASMPVLFDVTGGTSHSTTVYGLEDGRAYLFYVRCSDLDGDVNADDFEINFIVTSTGVAPIGNRAVWYLDEGAGLAVGDSSGQGNVGDLISGPDWIAGLTGQALAFDGNNDHVRVQDSSSLNFDDWAAATVALWVKPERLGHLDDQTLYGHWNASSTNRPFQVLLTPDDRLQCRTNHHDGEISSTAPVALGSWTHVACVWTPTGLSLYRDGAFDAIDADVDASLQSNSDLHTLGARSKSGELSQFFMGSLDEVHVFSRALSALEIQGLYAANDCSDSDFDGIRACDGDCNEANPDCTTDCTDEDSDGICVTHDCDDTTFSAGSTAFGEMLIAHDRAELTWIGAKDIRWCKGDLANVSAFVTTAAGSIAAVTSLNIAEDSPAAGSGVYYVVREQGCGSWQSVPGAEPSRDAELPLP